MKHSFKLALGFCLLLGLRFGVAAQTYQLTDLGALLSRNSYAHGINNQGQVVGYWETTNGFHAFLYSGGLMTDLGALGGTNAFALSINNPGQVVGFAEAQDGVQAFIFDAGGMTRLGTLGGLNSYAFGINANAEIVGYIATTEGARAYLYSGGGLTNLGTLGGTNSYAYGVNILAQVAGASATDGQAGTHAFLWQKGLLVNLNSLVPEDIGWELGVAGGAWDQRRWTDCRLGNDSRPGTRFPLRQR
jgi:probable HAF family extracellular repeat protein